MTFDATAKVNAAKKRGDSVVNFIFLHPTTYSGSSSNGWSDVNIMPSQTYLTCEVDDSVVSGSISKTASGVITGASGTATYQTRVDGAYFIVTNDGEASNTSSGIIKFDISELSGKSIAGGTLNAEIYSYDTEPLDTEFYYSIDNSKCENYVQSGSKPKSTYISTLNSKSACLTTLGTSDSQSIGIISHSSTSVATLNIKDALNAAIAAGKTSFYIVIVKKNAGGTGSADGWTDTKINPANYSIDYTTAAAPVTPTDANLDQLKDKVKEFEDKLATGTIYKGLPNAYKAYVNANKAVDAYTYGGDKTINITSYYDALNTAMNALTPFNICRCADIIIDKY